MNRSSHGLLATLLLALSTADALAARCLFISSYHRDYDWNFAEEEGMEAELVGKCELRKFYLDTLRHPEPEYARKKALEAKAAIEEYKPDVVIAADDPASKYVIMPYYRDAPLPFVFCGVNWSGEPYGFPYGNVTGMIEVSPAKPLLDQSLAVVGRIGKAVFLAADTPAQRKEFEYVLKIFTRSGVALAPVYVRNLGDWKAEYKKAQEADLVYLSTATGIGDWNIGAAAEFALEHGRKLSVSTHEAMAATAMLSMTNIPQEHGEWAAKVALDILRGAKPSDIPVVANRRSRVYVTPRLAQKAGIKLPATLLHKAIKLGN